MELREQSNNHQEQAVAEIQLSQSLNRRPTPQTPRARTRNYLPLRLGRDKGAEDAARFAQPRLDRVRVRGLRSEEDQTKE